MKNKKKSYMVWIALNGSYFCGMCHALEIKPRAGFSALRSRIKVFVDDFNLFAPHERMKFRLEYGVQEVFDRETMFEMDMYNVDNGLVESAAMTFKEVRSELGKNGTDLLKLIENEIRNFRG